jgi:ribose/xylose/arabinose/galactoside ABC-type transport system permease subunit
MANGDSETRVRVPGLITPIAWIYVAFGLTMAIACLIEAQIGPVQLSPADAVGPGLLIVAGVGAILRKPWGRWLCYAVSALLVLGVPIGTIIGVLMIYHLTVHRDQFGRSIQNLGNSQ